MQTFPSEPHLMNLFGNGQSGPSHTKHFTEIKSEKKKQIRMLHGTNSLVLQTFFGGIGIETTWKSHDFGGPPSTHLKASFLHCLNQWCQPQGAASFLLNQALKTFPETKQPRAFENRRRIPERGWFSGAFAVSFREGKWLNNCPPAP